MITRIDIRKQHGEYYFYINGSKFMGENIIVNNWSLNIHNDNIIMNCDSKANLDKSYITEIIPLKELSIFLVNSNKNFYFYYRERYIQDFLDKYNIEKIVSLSDNKFYYKEYKVEDESDNDIKNILSNDIIELFGFDNSFTLERKLLYHIKFSNSKEILVPVYSIEANVNDFIIVRKVDKENNIYKILYLNNTKTIEDIISEFNENDIKLFYKSKI